MANVSPDVLEAVRSNWSNFSAVIFFSGIKAPLFSNKLYRASSCAANDTDKSSNAAITGIGLGFIVEFKDLKITQIPEKCQYRDHLVHLRNRSRRGLSCRQNNIHAYPSGNGAFHPWISCRLRSA